MTRKTHNRIAPRPWTGPTPDYSRPPNLDLFAELPCPNTKTFIFEGTSTNKGKIHLVRPPCEKITSCSACANARRLLEYTRMMNRFSIPLADCGKVFYQHLYRDDTKNSCKYIGEDDCGYYKIQIKQGCSLILAVPNTHGQQVVPHAHQPTFIECLDVSRMARIALEDIDLTLGVQKPVTYSSRWEHQFVPDPNFKNPNRIPYRFSRFGFPCDLPHDEIVAIVESAIPYEEKMAKLKSDAVRAGEKYRCEVKTLQAWLNTEMADWLLIFEDDGTVQPLSTYTHPSESGHARGEPEPEVDLDWQWLKIRNAIYPHQKQEGLRNYLTSKGYSPTEESP